MKQSELLAHVYSSIFKYPLSLKDARLWRIKLRKNSDKKLEQAKIVTQSLQKIPFVEAVFLTGSAAAGNAGKTADIDLMIVTAPNTLWLSRLLITFYLKYKKLYKNIICPNIYLDTNHLEIKLKNLYTAHEVLQAKCLFDRSNIETLWLTKNKWTQNYLPYVYKSKIEKLKIENPLKIENCKLKILLPFEIAAFFIQFFYQKQRQTNESVGWGYAFFHPRDLSKGVLKKFDKKLKQLGIMKR
jgi:predicted nucleotidyltransferase